MSAERRVLAKLVRRQGRTARGVFELADGRHVELDGAVSFDAAGAPRPGEKAVVIVDNSGKALRWEPYAGTRLRNEPD
jgi:hypothetical protein